MIKKLVKHYEKTIRIATRKSPLALWQATYTKNALLKYDPELNIVFIGLTTQGDREQAKALASLGGKSLFVKELQKALLENEADIAVHSIKDMSVFDCPGLMLAAICQRDDPRDAFLSSQYSTLADLPKGAVIGTASPRRIALIKSQRSDITTKLLRGNVGTRLKKCLAGEYDAIILAVAGLKRLNLNEHITDYLDPEIFTPAIGQAAIGIECREDDIFLKNLLSKLNHLETAYCVNAERAANRILGGDCHTPIAAHAIINNSNLTINGMVGSLDGKTIIRSYLVGAAQNAVELGSTLGQNLLDKGAASLLEHKDDNHV